MIKAKARLKDDRPLYLFGLSALNLLKLRRGQPIPIRLEDMGGVGEVLIMFGESEQDMARELAHFIGPETQVQGSYSTFEAMKALSGAPLGKVLAALNGLDTASIEQFFSSPSTELAGLTPIEVMTGQLTVPRVLDNAGLEILKATHTRRLSITVGAAKAFHADATA